MKCGRKKSHDLSLHHIFFFSWLPKLKQKSITKPRFRSATSMQKTRPKLPESPPPVCFRRSVYFQPSRGFHVSSAPDCYASLQGLDIADPPISPQILSRRADKDLLIDGPEDTLLPVSLGKKSRVWGKAANYPEDCPEFPSLNERDREWNDKWLQKALSKKLQESQKSNDLVSSFQKMKHKGVLKWKQKTLDPAEVSLKSVQRSMKYEMATVLAAREEERRIGEAKSPHREGYLQRRKIGSKSSPRAVWRSETCKVKALENLKKARKKREREKRRVCDSFAVVKHSFNPHQDFRDSMIEMILENAIGQPKELENLLACYLGFLRMKIDSNDFYFLGRKMNFFKACAMSTCPLTCK